MAKLGEIKKGVDIGYKSSRDFVWQACRECGKQRWVEMRGGKPVSTRCQSCGARAAGSIKAAHYRGENHWHWQGGRSVMKNGYVEVWLDQSSPYYPMAGKDGYIYEHRLVAAQTHGRCLESWEEVHHINHDKHDNRPENLEVLEKSKHAFKNSDIRALIQRIRELENENGELRRRLSEE